MMMLFILNYSNSSLTTKSCRFRGWGWTLLTSILNIRQADENCENKIYTLYIFYYKLYNLLIVIRKRMGNQKKHALAVFCVTHIFVTQNCQHFILIVYHDDDNKNFHPFCFLSYVKWINHVKKSKIRVSWGLFFLSLLWICYFRSRAPLNFRTLSIQFSKKKSLRNSYQKKNWIYNCFLCWYWESPRKRCQRSVTILNSRIGCLTATSWNLNCTLQSRVVSTILEHFKSSSVSLDQKYSKTSGVKPNRLMCKAHHLEKAHRVRYK